MKNLPERTKEQIEEEVREIPTPKQFQWEDLVVFRWGSRSYKPENKKFMQLSDERKKLLDEKKEYFENLKITDETQTRQEIEVFLDRYGVIYGVVTYSRHDLTSGEITWSRQTPGQYLGMWLYSKRFIRLLNECYLRGLRIQGFRKHYRGIVKHKGEEIPVEYIEKHLKDLYTIELLVSFNNTLKILSKKKDSLLNFKQLYQDYKLNEQKVGYYEKEIKKLKKILRPDWTKKAAII